MLSLRNISKTYKTQSKSETQALKDVTLDIADKGMVFILGKSGSGKSTLLNLLGGLDNPTSGEILVDGVSMKQFTQRDYDSYRNNYVGFIFQEFNLLDDFNVRDNVAIALQLSKSDDVDAKVSDALKQVELNDNYLTRRIGEMSGGEKQRIAIARALIKDSRIILADEPTGNLDSATGESIWNILKSLSRERLVVVVSHDRESAEKYGDRIIEIADGQVVADNGERLTSDTEAKPIVTDSKRLPFAVRLKMGYNNLKLRKAKAISVILLAVFSILALAITQICLCFSAELTLAKYITKNNIDYFVVKQAWKDPVNNLFNSDRSHIWTNGSKKYIAESNSAIRVNSSYGLIESKQDILDFGLTFVGEAYELDDNSFYAATREIEYYYGSNSNGYVEIDGEYVEMDRMLHPYEFLVGKNVKFGWTVGTLAGIIDLTDLVNPDAIPSYFCTVDSEYPSVSMNNKWLNNIYSEAELRLSDKRYDKELDFNEGVYGLSDDTFLVTADGSVLKSGSMKLADNEVVLTYDLYAELFDADYKDYYISKKGVLYNMPPEIGQKFQLEFYEGDSGELIGDYGEVTLAGVIISFNDRTQNKDYTLTLSKNLSKQINLYIYRDSYIISVDSLSNLNKFVTTLRNSYLGCIEFAGFAETIHPDNSSMKDVVHTVNMISNLFVYLMIIFAIVSVLLVIILILMVINLISFSIANRKKEVGILSALGVPNKDITSIFLLETLIISVITFVILIGLSFAFCAGANAVISRIQDQVQTLAFLRVDLITFAVLIVSSFGLLLLAALIPVRKIIKLKPIDAIRNL